MAACYDLAGKRRWIKKIDTPRNQWGHSASPVLIGKRLFVLINDLVSINTSSGAIVWRKGAAARWGTPTPTMLGRTPVLITPNGDFFRATDGARIGATGFGLAYNQPVIEKRVVYFVDERGARAYRLPRGGGKVQLSAMWQAQPPRDRYYSSPVIHDGIVYAINQRGMFCAIDARRGRVLYQKSMGLGGGQAYPSIALAGKYLYVSGSSGTTAVLEPGRTYKEVARNTLEPFRSSPVFVGRRMYIRGMKNLYCIGK